MLDGLRRIGRTWIGKLLGAFLIVGLAGFGISNVLLDFGSTTVARVGDEEITTRDFSRAYDSDLNMVAQQIGQMPTPQMAVQLAIPSGTLNRLTSEAAINRLGNQMGLGVSDDKLIEMLRADPSFAGTLGAFEQANFERILAQAGFTEEEYYELQRKASRRQQIISGLLADNPVPDAALELVTRYSGDTRTIDYFAVNAQSLPPVAEPTEEELAAYLTEHQQDFRTAETRTADILVLSNESLAATKTITDAEIAEEYERTRANRQRAEQRTIRQAPLNAEQQAAFEAGKAAGKSFDELVAETGVAVTDLGTLPRNQVTDPALAEAAFGLAAGEFALIPGIGGQRAVSVSAVEPGGEVTLEEARNEIAADLAQAQARAEYVDVLDQVEELRAAFQPLPQIGERFGLKVDTIALTADGAELSQAASVAEADRQRVASAVFSAQEGKLAPTIAISANDNIFIELKSIEPARDQTLDEVRDDVMAAVIAEREREAVAAAVADITARLEKGEAFADVALSLNQFPILSQPMTRAGDGTPVLNQDVAAAAFAGGTGHFGAVENGDGDQIVFQVVEITPASTEGLPEQARTVLANRMLQSLYGDFVGGLRTEAGVRVNEQALDQILAIDPATGQ